MLIKTPIDIDAIDLDEISDEDLMTLHGKVKAEFSDCTEDDRAEDLEDLLTDVEDELEERGLELAEEDDELESDDDFDVDDDLEDDEEDEE